MTLRWRIMLLEGCTSARIVADAAERMMAYLDRIAARLPISTAPANAAELQAELVASSQRRNHDPFARYRNN